MLIFATTKYKTFCPHCHAPIVLARLATTGKWITFDNIIVAADVQSDEQGRTIETVDPVTSRTHDLVCPFARQGRLAGLR